MRSALAAPYQTAAGRELYPTVPAKAACLFRGLAKNHGLVDGNKRLAVTTMTAFLRANGWEPTYSNADLIRYAIRVADHHGDYPVKTIERWIRRHAKLKPRRELMEIRWLLAQLRRAQPPLEHLFNEKYDPPE